MVHNGRKAADEADAVHLRQLLMASVISVPGCRPDITGSRHPKPGQSRSEGGNHLTGSSQILVAEGI